jgi:hypothetical protein
MSTLKAAQERAAKVATQERAAKVATKEERARDAALAMREYEAEKLAVRAKTARLRALRLAKEAGNKPLKKAKIGAKEKR